MCADVMALSNNLIYNGRLKCGSQAVADRRLAIPNIDALKLHHHTPSTLAHAPTNTICPNPERKTCWLGDLLDPATTVAFINTDPLLPGAREEAKGNRIVNPTEAVVCKQLIEGLLTIGVPATDIGVMTHYRSQLSLLKDSLRRHPDVEMHTADRFQGRDKEVVVLSLVRSNDVHLIGELLKDWRRINVAFTRAKTKLLVVGSRDTLKGGTEGGDEMVAKFVALMEEKGWIYDLPVGALDSHVWDDGVTQTQGTNGIPTQVAVEWVKIKRENVAMKMENKENPPQKPKVVTDGAKKGKRKGLGIGHINGAMRQPAKKICGQKPFKIPRQSILTDIFNEEAL
jgi:DNA replication ATP-dependent helicase Dna2